jgi:hypothetical protein
MAVCFALGAPKGNRTTVSAVRGTLSPSYRRTRGGGSMKAIDDSTSSKPDHNVKWFTELKDLTPRVEREFTAATKAFEAPSRDACGSVASVLMVVRVRKDAAPLRKDITRGHRAHTRKSAKNFLLHLQPLKRKLEILIADVETMGFDRLRLAPYNEELERIAAAAIAVEALLPALNRPPIAPWPDNEPILLVAQKAQEAWAEANHGDMPTGKHEEDPLVKLVTGALGLVGICQSERRYPLY